MRLLLALLLLLPAAGAQAQVVIRQARAGEEVHLIQDRAYIYFRTVRPRGVPMIEPVLMRIPTEAELAAYVEARRRAYEAERPALMRRYRAELERRAAAEARGRMVDGEPPAPPSLETFNFVHSQAYNVQSVDADHAFVRGRPESGYLVEVVPGDYVLYGLAWEPGMQLAVCMCLGTVGFSAPAGRITDLGYFLADRVHEPSVVPELREESGFGPSSYGMLFLAGATVRPVRPDSSLPEALRGLDMEPARYRAVGRFVEPRAMAINRLAPVPGILEYDGGRVVDAATGREVPDVQ